MATLTDAHTDTLERVGIALYVVSSGNIRKDCLDPDHRFVSVPWYTLEPEDATTDVMIECPSCDGHGSWGEYDCHTCDGRGTIADPTGAQRPLTRAEREGMGRRQCTSEYKLKPIKRMVRKLLGYEHPRPVPAGVFVEQWIGFSTDEIHRVRSRLDVQFERPRYPLLELGMSRKACQRYLERVGWGHTAKSACIGCPFHGNAQWRALRDTCECGHHRDAHQAEGLWCEFQLPPNPDYTNEHRCECPGFRAPQWADAVEFDRQIRRGGARGEALRGQAFLHRSRVPLDVAPIDRVTRAEYADAQLDLFEDGDPDGCSPYGCRSGEPVTLGFPTL